MSNNKQPERSSPPNYVSTGGRNPKGPFAAAVFFLLLLLTAPAAVAQPSGFAGSFSRIGFGARGIAMGNALAATDAEGVYGYYNPALAGLSPEGSQVDLSSSLMSFDRTLHTLQASFRLPPGGGLTVGLISAGINDIDGRDASGYPTSSLSTREYQLLTAFGMRLSSRLTAGAGVKITVADYHEQLSNARAAGFDAGLLYRASQRISFGLAARDLLARYTWHSGELYGETGEGGTDDPFPARFNLSTSYTSDQAVFVLQLGLLSQHTNTFTQLRAGSAYHVHRRISLRAGWQIDDLQHIRSSHRPSGGFSLHLPFDNLSPSVDYAFMVEPGQVSSMHVFGITFNL